ncbi:MAG: TIGR02221 family CRISPR-associated protein [Fimbriimonadales bacterium]|nr:TIGR02221 family CRISPR-associated protein [Fimbriimonadales bacterium]
MRKLIAFLGTGDYRPAIYKWGEREYATCFFPQAAIAWTKPEEAWFLLTEEVKNHKNWRMLQVSLRDTIRIEHKIVPQGRNEEELWQIFGVVVEIVQHGDSLVFDITHGLRSLPVIFLLAVAYLRQLYDANIEHMLYGAFELADQKTGEVSVFDLTPFISLLDWLTAAKIFMTTGDGRELAGLVRAMPELGSSTAQEMAASLGSLSSLLMMNRAPRIPAAACEFIDKVRTINPTNLPDRARPLAVILQQISDTYEALANSCDTEAERELVRWYHKRGHMLQSATLGVELITNILIRCTKPDRLLNEYARQHVADTVERFYRETEDASGTEKKPLPDVSGLLKKLRDNNPEASELLGQTLWGLKKIRNDLAHCGYRMKSIEKYDEISQEMEKQIENLEKIANALREIQR